MLLLTILLWAVFLGLRLGHVTDWNQWAVNLPLLIGIPLWVVWTWLKIWAVTRIVKNGPR